MEHHPNGQGSRRLSWTIGTTACGLLAAALGFWGKSVEQRLDMLNEQHKLILENLINRIAHVESVQSERTTRLDRMERDIQNLRDRR